MFRTQAQVTVSDAAAAANAKLLETGEFSDLTLKFGGETFKVHRSIICPRSRIFYAECSGSFSEARTHIIEISAPTASRCSIKRMLAFLYKKEYEDLEHGRTIYQGASLFSPVSTERLTTALINNAHMYALGDFYGIDDLKALALEKFEGRLQSGSPFANLAVVVQEVFEHTCGNGDGLRCSMVKYVAQHRHNLLRDETFTSKVASISDFQSLLVLVVTDAAEAEYQELSASTKDIRQQLAAVRSEHDHAVQSLVASDAAKSEAETERQRMSIDHSHVMVLVNQMSRIKKCYGCSRRNDKAYKDGDGYRLTCGQCRHEMSTLDGVSLNPRGTI